jgi:hypothetical protein
MSDRVRQDNPAQNGRMHNLLQFWYVSGSIATLTVAVSVFESFRLLVGDKSFWVDLLVSIKVVIL